MEQIAHRVDENDLRPFPFERLFERVFVQAELEAIAIVWLTHGLQAFRHALGIAMFAAGTDLGAARQRVPGGFGPLDSRMFSHGFSSNEIANNVCVYIVARMFCDVYKVCFILKPTTLGELYLM